MADVNDLIRKTSDSYDFRKMLEFAGKTRQAHRDRRWLALKTLGGFDYTKERHPVVVANYVDDKLAKDRRDVAYISPCGTKIWTWQTEYTWLAEECGIGWIVSATPWPGAWHVPYGWPSPPPWELPPGTYLVPYAPEGCVYFDWPVVWPPPVPEGWPAYPSYDLEHQWSAGWWKPEVEDCPDQNPLYVPPWLHLEV